HQQDVLGPLMRPELVPGPGSEQNSIALLHLEGTTCPVLEQLAGADGKHLSPLWLVLGGVWQEDASPRLLLRLEPADNDSVGQRSDVHGCPPCSGSGSRMKRHEFGMKNASGVPAAGLERISLSAIHLLRQMRHRSDRPGLPGCARGRASAVG